MLVNVFLLICGDQVTGVFTCEACPINKFSRIWVLAICQASKHMTIGFVNERQDVLYAFLVFNGQRCEVQEAIILDYLHERKPVWCLTCAATVNLIQLRTPF